MSDQQVAVKFSDMKNKKQRVTFIREKLEHDDRWLLKGLFRIWQNQTAQEQNAEATIERNGIGFTGADAQILTSFVDQMIRKGFKIENVNTYTIANFFSPKQSRLLRHRMPKYAGQLENISTGGR